MYTATNIQIQQMSQFFDLLLGKLAIAAFAPSVVFLTLVNYFVFDFGADSYYLPAPILYVLHEGWKTKCEWCKCSPLCLFFQAALRLADALGLPNRLATWNNGLVCQHKYIHSLCMFSDRNVLDNHHFFKRHSKWLATFDGSWTFVEKSPEN